MIQLIPLAIGIVLGLVAGFLIGRKHPKVADAVADVANKVK